MSTWSRRASSSDVAHDRGLSAASLRCNVRVPTRFHPDNRASLMEAGGSRRRKPGELKRRAAAVAGALWPPARPRPAPRTRSRGRSGPSGGGSSASAPRLTRPRARRPRRWRCRRCHHSKSRARPACGCRRSSRPARRRAAAAVAANGAAASLDDVDNSCVEIRIYGVFVLNHRVVLHAIDATPARWRDDAGSLPLGRSQHRPSSEK